jgi:hypothetical protein
MYLIELIGFVVLLLGFALTLALIIAALSWAVEAVVRHRIGFYFGFVVMFVVAFFILESARFEIMNCGLFKYYVEGVCESSALFQLLSLSFMFVSIPLLLFSQIKLKKWSQSRHA